MPRRDVLNTKYDMGLFTDPYVHLGPAGSDPQDTNAELPVPRRGAVVARKTMVLLKNDKQTLPLSSRRPSRWSGRWPTASAT